MNIVMDSIESSTSEHATTIRINHDLPRTEMFDKKDFCAVTWLNTCFSPQSTDDSLNTLSRSVDDALHASHLALDHALARALNVVPWAVRETEKVRLRANTLRENVDGVGERVAGVEAGVASSVDTIARADDVVRRVEAVSSLLSQASRAERLQSQLEGLLASSGADGSDLVTAADVLARLRAELRPLAAIPECQERFRALDTADAKLEAMAAPQLKTALENRNGSAAANARVVFDRAGRENAFVAQYVSIRAAQVSKLWSTAWDSWAHAASPLALEPEGAEESVEAKRATLAAVKAKRRAMRGDISVLGADGVLSGFYANLQDLLQAEAAWLDTAFPDLRVRLLPSLLVAALAEVNNPPLKQPQLPDSMSGSTTTNGRDVNQAAKLTRQVPARMHAAALLSVAASGRICSTILPSWSDELYQDDGFNALAREAITAALAPHRLFLKTAPDAHARAARTAASAISLPSESFFLYKPRSSNAPGSSNNTPSKVTQPLTVSEEPSRQPPPRPSLNDLARDIENCASNAVTILDDCFNAITEQTAGVGMVSMMQSARAVANELSSRLIRMLKHKHVVSGGGGAPDEWARVSGSLRLLRAVSAFNRAWVDKKEAGLATAIGMATPALEAAGLLTEIGDSNVEVRLKKFSEYVSKGDLDSAAIVWELVSDRSMAERAVATFENAEATSDLQEVVKSAHQVVYENLIAGVRSRLAQISKAKIWNAAEGDEIAATVGASPMAYSTEVADYLMTVPQQLEPFVPDEEDAEYATPASVFAFSKLRGSREEVEDVNSSFAGMWIHVLAVGTMELYVERICGISKMSEIGARQLSVDIEYLCNVMSALGVAPTAEMALTRKCVECDADAVIFQEIAADITVNQLRTVVRKVATLRGVNVAL